MDNTPDQSLISDSCETLVAFRKSVVFTNNSVVVAFLESGDFPSLEVNHMSASAVEVLVAAKTAAREGAVLLSNPLCGMRTARPFVVSDSLPSVPKITSINPYLSMLMNFHGDTVDFESIRSISEAIALYKKNARLRLMAHNDNTLQEFQVIDLHMIMDAIPTIRT